MAWGQGTEGTGMGRRTGGGTGMAPWGPRARPPPCPGDPAPRPPGCTPPPPMAAHRHPVAQRQPRQRVPGLQAVLPGGGRRRPAARRHGGTAPLSPGPRQRGGGSCEQPRPGAGDRPRVPALRPPLTGAGWAPPPPPGTPGEAGEGRPGPAASQRPLGLVVRGATGVPPPPRAVMPPPPRPPRGPPRSPRSLSSPSGRCPPRGVSAPPPAPAGSDAAELQLPSCLGAAAAWALRGSARPAPRAL